MFLSKVSVFKISLQAVENYVSALYNSQSKSYLYLRGRLVVWWMLGVCFCKRSNLNIFELFLYLIQYFKTGVIKWIPSEYRIINCCQHIVLLKLSKWTCEPIHFTYDIRCLRRRSWLYSYKRLPALFSDAIKQLPFITLR